MQFKKNIIKVTWTFNKNKIFLGGGLWVGWAWGASKSIKMTYWNCLDGFFFNYFVLFALISTVFVALLISHTSQIYSKWNTYFTYYVIFIQHATLGFSTESLHFKNNASKNGEIIKANI